MNLKSMPRWLVITDGSVGYQPPTSVDASYLHYQFTDANSPDGLTAWRDETNTLQVASASRAMKGGFRQQALNRLVAQQLLQKPVDAIVLIGLYGCTVDLPRIFTLFNLPVAWFVQPEAKQLLNDCDQISTTCLADALHKTLAVNDDAGVLLEHFPHIVSGSVGELNTQLQAQLTHVPAAQVSTYDYSLYEFSLRDHPLLCLIQEPDVEKFTGCKRVLDLGCGAGIFVSLLQEAGITAVGVERNPEIAHYGRGMGLNIITDDALDFLRTTEERFDGIYCSHFVEHLPIEMVQELLLQLARVVSDNGVVVLAFPDPESIRSQLIGFWRDPEHVRFYHPELILSLAQAVGLDAEWTSYQDQPHELIPFSLTPPVLPEPIALPSLTDLRPVSITKQTWLEKLAQVFSIGSDKRLDSIAAQLSQFQNIMIAQQQVIARQQHIIQNLAERTEQLWAVNRTWAWNDNVVLKLRRRNRCL